MDPVVQAIINNLNAQTSAIVGKEVKCEICNILLSSYVVLRDHIAGRKHKHQFKILCRKKNKIDMNCVVCNYLCKDMNDYENHVTSESHVERAKVVKPQQQSVQIPPPDPNPVQHHIQPIQPLPPPPNLEPFLSAQEPVPQLQRVPHLNNYNHVPPLFSNEEAEKIKKEMQAKLNEDALRQILAKDKKEFNCINCSVTCQSQTSWDAHLASKKHRKNKHKFHTYPGISKEFVKRKYQNSFVRACETIGNEFIEDGVVFYCKRCDVRMESKMQLEIHMTSNQHKLNHPIEPVRPSYVPAPVQNNQQLFNFENSSYGYGFRNWSAEQFVFDKNSVPPPTQTQAEIQRQMEMERQRQLVEEAKNKLLARFPFYAINSIGQNLTEDPNTYAPQPVPPPEEVPLPPE